MKSCLMFPAEYEVEVTLAFQRSDNKQLWEERWLVVIEFSVTVRNEAHGLIVMMLSVSVWSCSDRYECLLGLLKQAESGKHACWQHYRRNILNSLKRRLAFSKPWPLFDTSFQGPKALITFGTSHKEANTAKDLIARVFVQRLDWLEH